MDMDGLYLFEYEVICQIQISLYAGQMLLSIAVEWLKGLI